MDYRSWQTPIHLPEQGQATDLFPDVTSGSYDDDINRLGEGIAAEQLAEQARLKELKKLSKKRGIISKQDISGIKQPEH